MAKKINMSRVKDFLFNHGEKVALGACAVLGIILGLWGVMGASGAGRQPGGKSWPEYFAEATRRIRSGIDQSGAGEPVAAPVVAIGKDWAPIKSTHVPTPYIAIADVNNEKRQRPKVLPIVVEESGMRYVNALVYQYDYGTGRNNEPVLKGLEMPGAAGGVNPNPMPTAGPKMPKGYQPMPGGLGGGAAGPSLPFAKKGEPQRMVVVHARFPMKQQMIEFQKALRLMQQDEMLMKNREDLPKPLGLDIIRVEVLPDDKVKSEVLVGYVTVKDNKITENPKQFTINKKLEDLLRKSMFDERSPEMMKEHIWAGLTMPMPRLANRQYPKFEMKGFEFDWTLMDDENPKQMAGGFGMPKPDQPPRKDPMGAIELPGMGKGRDKKFGPPEAGGGEPREPALEYLLKDIPGKEVNVSNPGLIQRIFGSKEKRVTADLNVFHVLARHEEPIANVNPGGFGMPGGPGAGMAGVFDGRGGMANQDQYFHAWDLNKGEPGKEGAGPMPTSPGPRPKYIPKGYEKPMPGGQAGMPGVGFGERFPDWDRDALVRFIDPDVKPGKKYKYWVRVRMANPNHNKPAKEVAFQDLTLNAELPPSEWVETPEIETTPEYHLYAIDQQLHDDWVAGAAPKKGVSSAIKVNEVLNSIPFQIHQWIESTRDESLADYMIGDWVISERKMVFKGDPIGPKSTVQAPVWFEKKDIFDVPLPTPTKAGAKKEPKGAASIKGIQVNMLPEGGKAPVLVDFAGGKRLTPANTLLEETAVDALILMPDGRLKVLNSRAAADTSAAAPNKTEAKERIDRLTNSRKRIDEVLNSAPVGDPGMPGMPGMPKGSPGPGPGPRGKGI
jgi:hypothetical protein